MYRSALTMERKPAKPRSKPATTRKKTATKKVAAKKAEGYRPRDFLEKDDELREVLALVRSGFFTPEDRGALTRSALGAVSFELVHQDNAKA